MKRQLSVAGVLSPRNALRRFDSLWTQFPWLTGIFCGIVAAGTQRTLHYPLQMPGRRDALFVAFALIAYRINRGKPVGFVCGIAAALVSIATLSVGPIDPISALTWPLLGLLLDWMMNNAWSHTGGGLSLGRLMTLAALSSLMAAFVHLPWYWAHHGVILLPWFFFTNAAFGALGVAVGQLIWAVVAAKSEAAAR